jgi:glycosyltransferase involved in cell wall biosynthesis
MRKLLHQWLWQSLPRNLRRSLLFQASSLAAPQPTTEVRPTPPLIVAGNMFNASGLGESARLCHDALKQTNLPVYGIDLTEWLMQPTDFPDYSFIDGRSLEGPGTLLLHVNSPLVPLMLLRLGQRFLRNKYIVGVWAWELPQVPPDWRFGLPLVHEIWVPTTFVAKSVQSISKGRPVRVAPYPIALRQPSPILGTSHGNRLFTVLVIFNMASSFARKNPVASIAAFRKAFGDDPSTRLIIKVSNSEAFPSGINSIVKAIGSASNIILIDRTMTVTDIDVLYRKSDLLISLHRSEGFGLTIAEAMLRGLPVVATDWSGNVDFLNPNNGFPIPYRLVPAEDLQGTYHYPFMQWADADVDAAAEVLRRLRNDPELARHVGKSGAAYAAQTWSDQAYAAMVCRYLGL